MEYHVVLEKLCKCAEKRSMEQIRTFNSKDEAEEHAHEWADALNNSLCCKHGFDVTEVDEHYVVSVEEGGFVEAYEL